MTKELQFFDFRQFFEWKPFTDNLSPMNEKKLPLPEQREREI